MDAKRKYKILIIEDDSIVLANLGYIFELEDYNVVKAVNGIDGLDKATTEQPDLIVCDISMPGMDGYQVLEKLKSNPETFSIPFIFLTARVDKADQRLGMQMGADDYITKPFEADDILNAIQSRLQKYENQRKTYESRIDSIKNVVSTTLPHELRSPLNSILGFTQIMKSNFRELTEDDIMIMLNNIENAGKRILRLIVNYLFFNRLMHQPDTFVIKDQGVLSTSMYINTKSMEIAKNYMRESDLKLDVENASVRLPDECFLKLVEEITDNAFKFSQPGSEINVTGKKIDNLYYLTVANFGVEFTSEQFSQISAFVQFDRIKYEQQGSGMGLAIVQKILNLFAGKLEMYSSQDSKTVVVAVIPM